MNPSVVIKDLPLSTEKDLDEIAMTPEQMKRLGGGRSVVATVDGRPGATVDDWEINTAIFEGRIKGTYL